MSYICQYLEYPCRERQEISSLIIEPRNFDYNDLAARATAQTDVKPLKNCNPPLITGALPSRNVDFECEGAQLRDGELRWIRGHSCQDTTPGAHIDPETYCRASAETFHPEWQGNFARCEDISKPGGYLSQGDWSATGCCQPGTVEDWNFNSGGRLAYCRAPIASAGRLEPQPAYRSCAEQAREAFGREYYPAFNDFRPKPKCTGGVMDVWQAEKRLLEKKKRSI